MIRRRRSRARSASTPCSCPTPSTRPIVRATATSNGDKLWAFRYSSEHDSRTLFFSTAIDTLRELYPDNMMFQELDEDTRLVVSEPLGDLPGAWHEVPESSYGVVQYGQ